MSDRQAHWEDVYTSRGANEVSWYQREPVVSLELVAAAGVGLDAPVIDVGGGASVLVDRLRAAGHQDVTVLDVAGQALAASRSRLGPDAEAVHWIEADLLDWRPARRYRLWHDRAVFHFLTAAADRARYRALLRDALAPDAYLILGVFAADGPDHCSGLPTERYSAERLAGEFDELRVVRAVREEHATPAGAVQPFTWLLLSAR